MAYCKFHKQTWSLQYFSLNAAYMYISHTYTTYFQKYLLRLKHFYYEYTLMYVYFYYFFYILYYFFVQIFNNFKQFYNYDVQYRDILFVFYLKPLK